MRMMDCCFVMDVIAPPLPVEAVVVDVLVKIGPTTQVMVGHILTSWAGLQTTSVTQAEAAWCRYHGPKTHNFRKNDNVNRKQKQWLT
jgi:hypothetical protein